MIITNTPNHYFLNGAWGGHLSLPYSYVVPLNYNPLLNTFSDLA